MTGADKRDVAVAVSIPEHLFASPAYRALGPLERSLLTEPWRSPSARRNRGKPLNISVRQGRNMQREQITRHKGHVGAGGEGLHRRHQAWREEATQWLRERVEAHLPAVSRLLGDVRLQPHPRPGAQPQDRGRSRGR